MEVPLAEIELPQRHCFPTGFGHELKSLFALAWPTSLSILFHYLIQPISLMFCGHLGKTQLASAALAISVIYVCTVSVGRGLAFGGDTFFSQVYGSANKLKVGVYLQKALLFGVLCSFPVWALLLNTGSLLLLLGQDATVSSNAQDYCLYFMPGVLAYCWLFTLMRYLLCQNKVIPTLIICVVSCGVNALLHYGLVIQAQMGIRGSAIALAMTYYVVLFLLASYIWGSGIYRVTWAGWSWECLEEWGQFARVTLSSVFMTFIFWLCTESGTFLAGLLGEEEISAFSIAFQVEGFAWMVPLGMGGACTARVGQYLGAKQPQGAITTCRVAITVQIFISLFMAAVAYAARFYIPRAFTPNAELIDYTGSIMAIVAIFLLLEGVGGVGMSIVRGTGRQTLGSVIVVVSWYLIALPVGIPLMFATHLALYGLWWSYVLGLGVQDLFLVVFVARLDWHREVEKAQERAGVKTITVSDPNDTEANGACINETTGLLTGEPAVKARLTPCSLVLRRLPVLVLVMLVLVAGFLVRLYVHVPVHTAMTELCIPTYNATSHDTTTQAANSSLPFCNTTETSSEVSFGRYSYYMHMGIWHPL